jgi:HEAT repeat protein
VKRTLVLLSTIFAFALLASLQAAEEPGDEVIQLIIGLVSDKDKDMRSVGLQQVREEAKGAAATKRFAALLPKLPAEAQAGMLDALGDRGDKAARPAVLEMLKSKEEQVRASALRALANIGETADVPTLAQSLTAAGPEKAAARISLAKLRGPEINAAIVAELKTAKAEARAELLGALAARKAAECVHSVITAAEDADPAVRAAALAALRVLADQKQTGAIVKLLKAAKEGQEQWKAEQALLAVCTRGREACVEPILAGAKDADASAGAALLRALARCGGAKALEAIVAATKEQRAEVRAEAVRALANWPDPSAIPALRAIAQQAEPIAQQGVAVEGLVRLASPGKDRPANVALLGEAMKLARRTQEKRLVLGVLGGLGTPEALALVAPMIDDPSLTDEACLAAVLIVEKLSAADQARQKAVLEKACDKAKDPEIRERAKKGVAPKRARIGPDF